MKNQRNNENWARPEADRQRRQAMREMRERDIRTGRPAGAPPRREAVPTKKKSSVIGARIIMYLIVFGVLLLLCAGIFTACFFSTPDKESSDMTFVYGTTRVKVKEENAFRNERLFVSFTRIADMLGMSRTGSDTEARFVLSEGTSAENDDAEYASFTKDSSVAFVSGSEIRLVADCFFSGDEVFVPSHFVATYMSGLNIVHESGTKEVTVERVMTAETDENGDFIPTDAHFLLQAAEPPERIDIGEAAYDPDNVVFTVDLTAYEQYMNPENAEDYLILVNRENTVGADYVPENLYDVVYTRNDRAYQRMVECAAKALEALFIEMKAAGYTDVSVTSGYRSYEYQDELYNSYVTREMTDDPSLTEEQAMEIADTYSARPGTSEHQTGLCCDMHNLSGADVAFAEEEAYTWLKQNAWKFGFIERFPENKTEITGYSFEPWHYRFVGRKAAAVIAGEGICLEEYLESSATE